VTVALRRVEVSTSGALLDVLERCQVRLLPTPAPPTPPPPRPPGVPAAAAPH
jgi:hypothetical protein